MESERNQLIMSKENLYNELKKLHEANEKLREQVLIYCIPESFNTNIAHQLFDYTIIFVNSQCENTNLKGDSVLKNRFEMSV